MDQLVRRQANGRQTDFLIYICFLQISKSWKILLKSMDFLQCEILCNFQKKVRITLNVFLLPLQIPQTSLILKGRQERIFFFSVLRSLQYWTAGLEFFSFKLISFIFQLSSLLLRKTDPKLHSCLLHLSRTRTYISFLLV